MFLRITDTANSDTLVAGDSGPQILKFTLKPSENIRAGYEYSHSLNCAGSRDELIMIFGATNYQLQVGNGSVTIDNVDVYVHGLTMEEAEAKIIEKQTALRVCPDKRIRLLMQVLSGRVRYSGFYYWRSENSRNIYSLIAFYRL